MTSTDLLTVPDAVINEALARAMEWRSVWSTIRSTVVWYSTLRPTGERFNRPPDYCSEDSPRSLLGEVDNAIENKGAYNEYATYILDLMHLPVAAGNPLGSVIAALTAPARIRARAALWAFDRATAERL